jgi:hypothetical protein
MKRVTLRRCSNVIEADTLRIRLAAAGIDAVIQGGEGFTALGQIGGAAGYPQLDVRSEDYDRAVAVLQADESASEHAKPWICSRCDERNEATFDLCWSCQKTRDESDQAVAKNPYRPASWQQGDEADSSDQAVSPEQRRDTVPESMYLHVLAFIVAAIIALAFYVMIR